MVGPADTLTYIISLPVEEETVISAPTLDQVLGRLNITSPLDASLTIYWPGGSTNYTVGAGESLILWAAPGDYQITYTINGTTNTTMATVSKGETTTVELRASPPQQPQPQPQPQPDQTNRTKETPGGGQPQPGEGSILLGAVIVLIIIGIATFAYMRRGG